MMPPGMCTRIDKRRAHVYGRGDDKLVATNIRCDCNAMPGRTSPKDPKFNPVVCELGDVADVSDDEDGPGAAGADVKIGPGAAGEDVKIINEWRWILGIQK